jgi:L-threonylcarbamoyladenylate synthase
MAVSSANRSGQPAALTCDDAIDQLGDAVSVYLDGGELAGSGGAPSTIVDFTHSDDGEILRVGVLSVEVVRETLPDVVDLTAGPEDSVESEDEAIETDEPDYADELADVAEPAKAVEPVESKAVEPVESKDG